MFKNIETGAITYFENPDGDEFVLDQIRQIIRNNTLITFNGTGFDMPLLTLALHGKSTLEIYQAATYIIEQNAKWWNVEKKYLIKINDGSGLLDHIDVMEVAPLTGSLKLYSARLHCRSIRDLPIKPGTVVTEEQILQLRAYCETDCQNTIHLFNALKEQIALREAMTQEYGIDLRSKSDAQIAEAVIVKEVVKLKQKNLPKPHVGDLKFHYKIPGWMSFERLDLLDDIRKAEFVLNNKGRVVMPKELEAKKIALGTGIYRMGIGGLHSSESHQVKEADELNTILDFDVTSYYPSILLNLNLYPKHIGPEFNEVYRTLFKRRIEAKKNKWKTIAESLKVVLNSSFGKMGSQWSALYAPDLMVQVTLTGQLAILMLVEAFWKVTGCEVISANTDGVTVRCARSMEHAVLEAAEVWELITGFSLERADYSGLYSRDVNNYLALKTDGEVKVKGIYGVGLPLQKNPQAHICSKAVIDYLNLGASIRGTIACCTDIREFLCIQQVTGGAVYQGEELGRVARWYYARGSEGHFQYKLNGNKVPKSDGAKPLMKIDDYNQLPDDLDYDWYVEEAESRLQACSQLQEVACA